MTNKKQNNRWAKKSENSQKWPWKQQYMAGRICGSGEVLSLS